MEKIILNILFIFITNFKIRNIKLIKFIFFNDNLSIIYLKIFNYLRLNNK